MTDWYKVKKIYKWVNWVEKQIYPAGWNPWANTVCYYSFDNTLADWSWNHADASNISSCTFTEAYSWSTKKVLNKPNWSYISLPSTFLQTAISEYSMIFWFKSTQTSEVWLMGCNGSNNIWGYPWNVLGWVDGNGRFWFLYGRDYYYRRIAYNQSTYRDGNWHLLSIRRWTGDVIIWIDTNYTTTYILNTPQNYSIWWSWIRWWIWTRSTNSGWWIQTTSVFQLWDFITENKYWTDSDLTSYYNQTKSLYGL